MLENRKSIKKIKSKSAYSLFTFYFSSSLDSPAGSTQEMTHGRAVAGVQQQSSVVPSSVGSLSTLTTNVSSTTLSGSDNASHFGQTYEDSDFETEPDPPDWRLAISQDDLARLKPKERKRQDVINGKIQLLDVCPINGIGVDITIF